MSIDINEFVKRIEEDFDEIEPGTLDPDKAIDNLIEWSSMNVLMILSLIKTEFGVNLSADKLKKCNTLRELFNMVQSMETTA